MACQSPCPPARRSALAWPGSSGWKGWHREACSPYRLTIMRITRLIGWLSCCETSSFPVRTTAAVCLLLPALTAAKVCPLPDSNPTSRHHSYSFRPYAVKHLSTYMCAPRANSPFSIITWDTSAEVGQQKQMVLQQRQHYTYSWKMAPRSCTTAACPSGSGTLRLAEMMASAILAVVATCTGAREQIG